jgi:CheY-like chemotaxis protein
VDLVIVDFMMPLLDGAGTAKAMTEQPSLKDIPIMMSAASEDRVRKRSADYTAFLRQLFRVSALIQLVHKVLPIPPP